MKKILLALVLCFLCAHGMGPQHRHGTERR